jgi:probable phosphoglycerate mutase
MTERGEAQSRTLRDRLAGRHFDLELCSPLARARRTAELAGLTAIELESDLVEWDYGDFEGRTTEDIRQDFPGWTIWDGPWPGGETIDQVAERADRVIARIRALDDGATVALVAHGHLLRVLAARWIASPPQVGRSLVLEVGTISELGWEHETPAIRRWNT